MSSCPEAGSSSNAPKGRAAATPLPESLSCSTRVDGYSSFRLTWQGRMNIHSRMADKRDQILEAALELFVERGFHGTAVPAIAERAGVAAGTIYRYFESKEALVNELYQHWKRRFAGHFITGFSGDTDPRTSFGRLYRQLRDFTLQNPMAFAFLETHHHGSYLDTESRALEQSLTQTAAQLLRALQEANIVRKGNPYVLMSLVLQSLVGLHRAADLKLVQLDSETLKLAEDSVWDALRVHG